MAWKVSPGSLTYAVYPHNHTGSNLRAAEQGCDCAFRKPKTLARFYAFPVTQDERNLTHELTTRNGLIGLAYRIPLCLNPRMIDIPGHNTVGYEPRTCAEQYDVSLKNVVVSDVLNYEYVSGPNGGQHAAARDPQSEGSGRTQLFSSQFAFDRIGFSHGRRGRIHDAF